MSKRKITIVLIVLCILYVWGAYMGTYGNDRCVLLEMESFYQEASVYAEEIVPLATENLMLLDSLRIVAWSLPYEEIYTDGIIAQLDADRTMVDLSQSVPAFFQILSQLEEKGLVWEIISVNTSRKHIGFQVLTKVEGGVGYSIFITSPPIEDTNPNFKSGFVQLSNNWGISWSVYAMNGM